MHEDQRRFDERVFSEGARHPNTLVRNQVALSVGRLRNPAGTPLLLDLLLDSEPPIRAQAAFALGLIGDPLALDRLREIALSPPSDDMIEVQLEAVTAILKLGDADASSFAGELLSRWVGQAGGGQEPPETALRGLKEAWRLASAAPVSLLVQYAASQAPEARKWSVYSLARLRAPEAANVLLDALDDPDAWVRSQAVRALTAEYADTAGLERRGTGRRVGDLAGDPDPHVRINALRALGTYADPAFAANAVEATSDRDPNVRVQALATLGQLGGEDAARILDKRTDRGPFAERREALLGMVRVARDEALIKSAAWIIDPDWQYRAAGADALSGIGGDTAVAWSEGLTRDEDGRVVARGFAALGEIDTLRARYLARQLIEHPEPTVRTMAANTIRTQPVRTDVEILVRAYTRSLQDPSSGARIALVRALAAVAELGFSERLAVEDQFLARYGSSSDHLVRRVAAEEFPTAAALWGDELPVDTGRDIEDYRDIARRLIVPAERNRRHRLIIETERGTIRVSLFASDAPMTVDALLRLADRNYFEGGRWHRVVPNFVIQDGDPSGGGEGGPGFTLRDEINRHRYEAGTVGMALSGPDTGGSQFFITHSRQPHLDGVYTVVGRVESGMDVVNRVTQGDRIRSVRRG